MNSLLNVAIRERHGYAYTVESAVTLFSDSGLMTVYFGSDERYAKRCLNLGTALSTRSHRQRCASVRSTPQRSNMRVSCSWAARVLKAQHCRWARA